MKQRTSKLKFQTVTADDLRNDLKAFEAKYGMSTETFLQKYEGGEIGDSGDVDEDFDFDEWAGIHEWLERETETHS